MAASESVGAGQCDHGAVVKAHAAEDGADMAAVLAGVWQTAVGCAEGHVAVGAASPVWDLGALHLLDGANATEDPEIGVGDPWEGLLDGGEEVAGCFEAGVGAVVAFRGEAHGGAIGATGVGQLVVAGVCQLRSKSERPEVNSRSRSVPCETQQDGTVATIVVFIMLLQQLRNLVVRLLVVLKSRDERLLVLLAE